MSAHALLLTIICLNPHVDAPARDAGKKDLEPFQGAWQAVVMQNADGKQATPDELRDIRLVVKGNTFSLKGKDFELTGTFSVDPKKTPNAIDVTLTGSKPEEKILGIYELSKQVRRSCFAMPGKERPATFMTNKPGFVIFEWKPAK